MRRKSPCPNCGNEIYLPWSSGCRCANCSSALPDRAEPISTALTLEEFKRAFTVRPTDAVCPCHCGSVDCPGWKIVTDADRAMAEAFGRLPEILNQLASELGRKMADDLNRRFFEALTG